MADHAGRALTSCATASTHAPTSARRTSSRSACERHALHAAHGRRVARPTTHSGARPAQRPQRARCRGRGADARAWTSTRSSPRLERPLSMPHRINARSTPGRWTHPRRHVQRGARLDDRGARPAGRACPGAAWPCSARCWSWVPRVRCRASRVGATPLKATDVLVGVGAPAQIYADAAEAAGMGADRMHTAARPRGRAARPASTSCGRATSSCSRPRTANVSSISLTNCIALSQPESVA